MTIFREGKFLIDIDLQGVRSIGIESAFLSECVKEAICTNSPGVFGSTYHGFEESNLSFLSELPKTEKVSFWDVKLDELSAIYALKNLRYCHLDARRPGLDFSQLKKLEQLIWPYNKKDSGLEKLEHLEVLHMWNFNPRSRVFKDAPIPISLRELQLNWVNVNSLATLPTLPQLRMLEIHNCRNLEGIEELPRIAPKLEHLVIPTSRKFSGSMPNCMELDAQQQCVVRV